MLDQAELLESRQRLEALLHVQQNNYEPEQYNHDGEVICIDCDLPIQPKDCVQNPMRRAALIARNSGNSAMFANWDAAKFWLDASQWIFTLATALFVWLRTGQDQNRQKFRRWITSWNNWNIASSRWKKT
ncbi:hypothetical protein [Aliamphritea spongicola]|nr:hypothetical protein [Aliamphritea spongicola]